VSGGRIPKEESVDKIWVITSYWPGSGVVERFKGASPDRAVAEAEARRLDGIAEEEGWSVRHDVEGVDLLAGHAGTADGFVLVRAKLDLPDCQCLEVDCAEHDAFEALPRVVEMGGTLFGLTGWNSDRGVAYYKDTVAVAQAVDAGPSKVVPSGDFCPACGAHDPRAGAAGGCRDCRDALGDMAEEGEARAGWDPTP
jgi:hypothetical protein